MEIKVVNKYHHRLQPNDYYIGRGSFFGNPYTHFPLNTTKAKEKCSSRKEALIKYCDHIANLFSNPKSPISEELERITSISEKYGCVNFICFCKPKACHGEILKRFVDKLDKDGIDEDEARELADEIKNELIKQIIED
jgi:hypothetical protein